MKGAQCRTRVSSRCAKDVIVGRDQTHCHQRIVVDIPLCPVGPAVDPNCPRSFSRAPKRTQRARLVDFTEEEEEEKEEKTEKGSAAVGRDGRSWRPRRASSASSSLAPRPSESRILLSTRSTRVRLASDKRATLAYKRAVLQLDSDDPCRVRLTALTVPNIRRSAEPLTRPPRRMGTGRSHSIAR